VSFFPFLRDDPSYAKSLPIPFFIQKCFLKRTTSFLPTTAQPPPPPPNYGTPLYYVAPPFSHESGPSTEHLPTASAAHLFWSWFEDHLRVFSPPFLVITEPPRSLFQQYPVLLSLYWYVPLGVPPPPVPVRDFFFLPK